MRRPQPGDHTGTTRVYAHEGPVARSGGVAASNLDNTSQTSLYYYYYYYCLGLDDPEVSHASLKPPPAHSNILAPGHARTGAMLTIAVGRAPQERRDALLRAGRSTPAPFSSTSARRRLDLD